MKKILSYDNFIKEDYKYDGSEYGRYARMPFNAAGDPDDLTTGIMGKKHTLVGDDLQFDPEKVLEIIRKEPFAAQVAGQVMSANAPDFDGALGDEQVDGLKQIFDLVINRNYKLRQMYKALPDKQPTE